MLSAANSKLFFPGSDSNSVQLIQIWAAEAIICYSYYPLSSMFPKVEFVHFSLHATVDKPQDCSGWALPLQSFSSQGSSLAWSSSSLSQRPQPSISCEEHHCRLEQRHPPNSDLGHSLFSIQISKRKHPWRKCVKSGGLLTAQRALL